MAEFDEDTEDEAKGKGGSGKKTLILALVGLLVLGGATAGSLYFMGVLDFGGGASTEEVEDVKADKGKKEPIYYSFEQPFTVNFETQSGLRFLQVNVELMSYDQGAIDALGSHLPVIKNNIILLFSNQSYGTLITREGKDQLRQDTLTEIQGILKKYYGKPGIEEVYFTSFVMQ